MIYNNQDFLNSKNKSLLSEDSVFNIDGSQKHSTKNSNTGSFKSKSISLDLTYSDDEIASNRKKSQQMLNRATNDKILIKKEDEKEKKKQVSFAEFCEEMNKKLFSDLSKK